MIFDISPYIWVFGLTIITMGLIYKIHCKQQEKSAKQRLTDAKDRRFKKAQVVATGLVALAAVENKEAIFKDEDNGFFRLFMDEFLDHPFDDMNAIARRLEQQMNDDMLDHCFDDMKDAYDNYDFFDNDNMFSESQDIFNDFNNDLDMNDAFPSHDHFDNTFDDHNT